MTFVIDFSISRDFETQFINSLIREKEKNLISTKNDDKFKNEDIFHHNDDNSINEKSFIDDNDDIDIEFKSMTKKKSNFFNEKRFLKTESCEC